MQRLFVADEMQANHQAGTNQCRDGFVDDLGGDEKVDHKKN
jgi:hypothetical protein